MRGIVTSALAAALLVPLACSEGDGSSDGGATSAPSVSGVVEDIKDQAGEAMKAFRDRFADDLRKYEASAESLKATLSGSTDETAKTLLEELDERIAEARQKLDELNDAGTDAAATIRSELETLKEQISDLIAQGEAKAKELGGGIPQLPGGGGA